MRFTVQFHSLIFQFKKLPVYLIFLFVWSTVVYDFVTYWTWAPHGWLHAYGVIDYAGGTPVHVCSGFSALAYESKNLFFIYN